DSAMVAAQSLSLDEAALGTLRELGECLNYNAYGETVEDLHFHPAELFRRLQPYQDPLAFAAAAPEFARLRAARDEDWSRARQAPVRALGMHAAAVILPDEKWSRRISGLLANELATQAPLRAHAVLTQRGDSYVVSLRAPLQSAMSIDEVARRFGGNGR